MINIFEQVEKFFSSINAYIDYNLIFIIFLSLFILTIFAVIISTSNSYEAKLIKSIDMFNNYFINNPQITEDNLVQFNNRMKMRKVPKQLRKQWQQFVLYRENKASTYMSFEACVSTPIKNSTYKRDVTTMNIIAYILALVCFLLNVYRAVGDIAMVLQKSLLCPILILVLNYIVTIFLDLRHNAIVSDLNSNYQYFEVNMDKATQTLPEYVDYEVLFDRNEIKRGIPILYAYLQKRAEEEQKELERARLKNVEHEKFNFDEAGVESSLVLERAMKEAEDYIAERKKYLQDIEIINADITQEEMSFRETTKEYQRQMQVSKETFENFKQQLNEVSSSIQANYLKKQQQQELDRQRNLERDYDTATDRHKKLLDDYQAELKSVEDSINKARQSLEKAMMSEFDTYSNKVYEEAYKTVEDREGKKQEELKSKINSLVEELQSKQNEINSISLQNQDLINQLNSQADVYQQQIDEREQVLNRVSDEINNRNINQNYDYYDYKEEQQNIPQQTEQPNENYDFNNEYIDNVYADNQNDYNNEYFDSVYPQNSNAYTNDNYADVQYDNNNQNVEQIEESVVSPDDNDLKNQPLEEQPVEEDYQTNEGMSATDIFNIVDDEPRKKAGRPRKTDVVETEKRSVGRPRKVQEAQNLEISETPKRRGRPKKVINQTENVVAEVKRRGRPKKIDININQEGEQATEAKHRGRPKKVVNPSEIVVAEKKKRGRPKKGGDDKSAKDESPELTAKPKKGRGRPKKVDTASVAENLDDIDAYLDEINNQIAEESAKMEDAKKNLENKSKISKKN